MPILNNPDLIEISGKFFNIVWILIKKEESFSSAIGSRYLSTHAVEPFLEQRTTIVSFKITITSSKTFPVDSLSTEALIQSTLMTLQVLTPLIYSTSTSCKWEPSSLILIRVRVFAMVPSHHQGPQGKSYCVVDVSRLHFWTCKANTTGQ